FVQSFGATSEAAQLRAWAALPWKPVPCSVQDMGVAYRGTCSLDSDQERYEETGSKQQRLAWISELAIFQTLFSPFGRVVNRETTDSRNPMLRFRGDTE
ncbi:rbcL, partial [Symbiodinium necroappetens]